MSLNVCQSFQGNALVDIISGGVQAASLSLPCRDMCEAVTSTCSCGQERTVGDLLKRAMEGLLVSISTTCIYLYRSSDRGAPDHWLYQQH